uniref:Uncharacterized protein n=1 Tax=Solanum lycopersicum TaxID=4081 RepID=A0A3Q7F9F7_SOLLC
MTVHDVPLMPGDCSSLQRLSARSFHINIINLPPKVVVMVYSMMKVRPSVKMKLVNIWNNKLQAQGECTSTHDGESIEEFAPTKTQKVSYFSDKISEVAPKIILRYFSLFLCLCFHLCWNNDPDMDGVEKIQRNEDKYNTATNFGVQLCLEMRCYLQHACAGGAYHREERERGRWKSQGRLGHLTEMEGFSLLEKALWSGSVYFGQPEGMKPKAPNEIRLDAIKS